MIPMIRVPTMPYQANFRHIEAIFSNSNVFFLHMLRNSPEGSEKKRKKQVVLFPPSIDLLSVQKEGLGIGHPVDHMFA